MKSILSVDMPPVSNYVPYYSQGALNRTATLFFGTVRRTFGELRWGIHHRVGEILKTGVDTV